MLRIQKERLAGMELDLSQYIQSYQLNSGRLTAAAPSAVVLHPGPMIRGLEISDEVADGRNSAIEEQVAHGLAVRSALLIRALEAGSFEGATA
jgi:aspartate carbamoyltransferase catalytic subunit